MTKTRTALVGLFAAASLAGVAVGAHAQMNAQRGSERAAPTRSFDPAAREAKMQERKAARSQRLHDILAITPAQENAWRAYQAATEPPARGERQRPDRSEMAQLTTPQRLDRMVAEANARHSQMLARVNATKTFYAQLSPAQRKAFDALPGAGGERGMRGHGGPRGGRHMGPGGPDGFGEGRGPGRDGPRGQGPAA